MCAEEIEQIPSEQHNKVIQALANQMWKFIKIKLKQKS